jgi:hypothetical protein
MAWDSWYDVAIRELSERGDPAKELLAEAAELLPAPPADAEEEEPPLEVAGACHGSCDKGLTCR